ncbi:MAG: SCO family protein [Arenimonas sp.]
MKKILFACLFSFALFGHAATPKPAPLPSDSVLQISDTFTNQNGRDFKLSDRRGKPQLVAMFYTSCKYICPLIIDSGKGVDNSLTPAERKNLSILLVSMDPARDTPEALMFIVNKRKLDTTRWTLSRTDEKGVRTIAALLGIRYRLLADGEFNHTSALILLDAEGRIVARTETLGSKPDPAFLAIVKKTLASTEKR